MRIAVISDIHGDVKALETALEDIRCHSVDKVYCLGDLVGYRSEPNQVIELIGSAEVASVMGDFDEIVGFDLPVRNHFHRDRERERRGQQALRRARASTTEAGKRFLRSLPIQIRERLAGIEALFVHGSPRQIDEYLYTDQPQATFQEIARLAGSDVIFFGHSGEPIQKKIGGTWFVNPGSVCGAQPDRQHISYCLADMGEELRFQFLKVEVKAEQVSSDDKTILRAEETADSRPKESETRVQLPALGEHPSLIADQNEEVGAE